MDRMTIPMEWKATSEDGVLEGYASTFGNVDLGDDMIEDGAFTQTLREDIRGGGIPLLADHMPTTASVLGTIFDGAEDGKGLRVRAKFSAAPSAQDVYVKTREGHIRSMSIGYSAVKFRFEEMDGRQIRVLEQVKLWETSVVVFPMNPEASIERVKSLVHDLGDAERQELVDGLRGELAAEEPDTEDTDAEDDSGGDGEPEDGQVSPASGGDAEAAHVEAEGDEPKWDRWRSEALLNGTDPDAKADPAELARMLERIRLNDEAFGRAQKRLERQSRGEELIAQGRSLINETPEEE